MSKIKDYYNHMEEYVLVISLVATVLIITMQIVCRYILNASLSWSEELTRYIFIWQSWLGASYGLRHQKHLKVEFFYNFCRPMGRKLLSIAANVIFFAFCVFLVVNGGQLVLSLAAKHSTSTALKLPLYLIFASLPFSSFIMMLRLIGQTIHIIQQPAAGFADVEGGGN